MVAPSQRASSAEWFSAPRTDAAAYYPMVEDQSSPRNYGWYWNVTQDVEYRVEHLYNCGRAFNVWETPQAKAIEWLIGERIQFTANFDHALHGAFCIICSIELLCRNPTLHGDIAAAIARIEKARPLLYQACDELAEIQPEVLSFMDRPPQLIDSWSMTVSSALETLAFSLGSAEGALRAELAGRERLLGSFAPLKIKDKGGRPVNWVARFIAMRAADIYVTAGFTLEPRAHGSKSFLNFLEHFSIGYPDAERADKRELAKSVRRESYLPQPFAPVRLRSGRERKGGKTS